jgi:hypothetical protein
MMGMVKNIYSGIALESPLNKNGGKESHDN